MSEKRMTTTHRLVLMAMLAAVQIVLSRFLSINVWNLKIGFSFLPIALAGMLLGPVGAGLTGAIADFVGATLFPSGPFFPGFTLSAFVMGFGYGLFLKKKQTLPYVVGAVLFSEIIGSLLLNTLWISMLWGTPFWAVLPPRVVQSVGMGVVEIVTIPLLAKYFLRALPSNSR